VALLLLLLLCRHGVPVLDSYEASLQLHDGHVTVPQSIAGIIDCLHFCRPSLGEVSGSGNGICGMIAVLAEPQLSIRHLHTAVVLLCKQCRPRSCTVVCLVGAALTHKGLAWHHTHCARLHLLLAAIDAD
jgi:Fe-S-cluster-containing hydrogenase component 2